MLFPSDLNQSKRKELFPYSEKNTALSPLFIVLQKLTETIALLDELGGDIFFLLSYSCFISAALLF